MSSPSSPEDENGYQAALAREDRWNAHVALTLATITGLAFSSFLEAVGALLILTPMLLFNTASYGWLARRLFRTGYMIRGKAMMGNFWRSLAVSLVLGLIFWIQARYGLWFAQYLRDGFH